METKWKCPHCKADNTDDPEATAVPLCAGCDKDVHWDEIEPA